MIRFKALLPRSAITGARISWSSELPHLMVNFSAGPNRPAQTSCRGWRQDRNEHEFMLASTALKAGTSGLRCRRQRHVLALATYIHGNRT